jgi:hypothetical protein
MNLLDPLPGWKTLRTYRKDTTWRAAMTHRKREARREKARM